MRVRDFPIIAMLTILFAILLSGCGQSKTFVQNAEPIVYDTAPIECGTDEDCYTTAEIECRRARVVIQEDESGMVLNAEVRGIIEGRCNEYLVAKAPEDIAGLDAVCEIPLGLEMQGQADICKYCEGQLIDALCE